MAAILIQSERKSEMEMEMRCGEKRLTSLSVRGTGRARPGGAYTRAADRLMSSF